MKKIQTIVAIAILLTGSAFAGGKKDKNSADWLNAPTPDGSPTLGETRDWLAKVLVEYSGHGGPTDFEWTTGASIDNTCHLSWTTDVYDGNSPHPRRGSRYSLPLGAVTDVSIADSKIMIATGDVAAIAHDSPWLHQNGNQSSAYINLMPDFHPANNTVVVPLNEIAPRIQKALQHAVDLCKSVYQQPAQTKEPF